VEVGDNGKVHPKYPVTKVSGRKTAATIVSQLITSPCRSDVAELKASIASRVSSRQSLAASKKRDDMASMGVEVTAECRSAFPGADRHRPRC